ncbi:MAG: glycoside hydrolase family 2, partial [bacterium]|nr:glycoside hydrolase family 2 [bacterium]
AMFEAFGINKPNTTGIIQWMLNSAWPQMFWQLYDYYLMPNGAFYGAKIGSQPLNIAYHYGNHSIHVVNDTFASHNNLKAEIRILDLHSKTLYTQNVTLDIGEYKSQKVLDIPRIANLTTVYFLDLKLRDANGTIKGDNFYWLSTRPDVLNQKAATWFHTPQETFADFKALKKLPKVTLRAQHRFETKKQEGILHVTLENPTGNIAFFIRLSVIGEKSGQSILPVFWDDNYISLLPYETKTINARFPQPDPAKERPIFRLSGWNVNYHAARGPS